MISESLTAFTLPAPDGHDKTIRVYVPAHEEDERLPVIYMTDGQNLFEDGAPGQPGCWFTREAVRAERQSTGRAAVIVGIHNDEGAVARTNELTPQSIGEVCFPPDMPEKYTPSGEAFDRFVVDTVMPAVERRFPVQTGREHTAFCGSSSGGLQAYFTALRHPDLFSCAGVFSPAFLLYDTADILRWTRERLTGEPPFLFLYSGGGDPLEQKILVSTDAVYDGLLEWMPPDRLAEIILPDQPHHESAWAPVFRDFLHTFTQRSEDAR